MRRQMLPPPTDFTWSDRLHIALSVLILALGMVILWRTLPFGLTIQAIVISAAFIGFGVYRLWMAVTRLCQWKARR